MEHRANVATKPHSVQGQGWELRLIPSHRARLTPAQAHAHAHLPISPLACLVAGLKG